MKASAVKNELNAVLHFIDYLKIAKNLAVNDHALYMSLENLKVHIHQTQKGTLKKINKDRQLKTARNVQKGIPYSVDDVKQQYAKESLMSKVGLENNLNLKSAYSNI